MSDFKSKGYSIIRNAISNDLADFLYQYFLLKRTNTELMFATTYIQPWQTEEDTTKLYKPEVVEGDIMIIPQFIYHYTEPNTINFKKRIISFDFI